MDLGQLISTLAAHPDQDAIVPHGFANPHSYRGYYECVAFESVDDVSVAEMLVAARDANGRTFDGWKGGEYRMDDHTDVYLATLGETGIELSALLLDFILQSARPAKTSNDAAVAPTQESGVDAARELRFLIDVMANIASNPDIPDSHGLPYATSVARGRLEAITGRREPMPWDSPNGGDA